ncbi:MAG: dephospho-CoA kinase [Oligoflexia bacterium]|nr:dephospho-CoA kinase [Oligoflexia bacterium]
MRTILITGSIGSGKSWAINWLKKRSQPVFQADSQAKKLLQTGSVCYPQLKKLFFESDLYLPNGEFNKKKLAQKIFQDLKKRKAMEALIHPLVRKAFRQFAEEQKKKGANKVFYEAPLISKSILKACDKRVLITCPISIRKQRLTLKGWSEPEIEERFSRQMPDSAIKQQVDFIIDNSGDFKKLELQLNEVLLLLEE